MEIDNLWGDLPDSKRVRTPKTILKGQADYLEKLTGGMLKGSIRRAGAVEDSSNFAYRMEIVSEAIENYAYALLRIEYPATLYPLEVNDYPNEASYQINSEDEFVSALKEIFSSKSVKKAIAGLLSISESDE